MESKSPFMSKTLWVNLVLALASVLAAKWPDVSEVVTAENVALLFSFVNMVLRSVTKDALSFK